MPKIRIPEDQWEKVWWELTGVGPISRSEKEPVYLVSKKHIEHLDRLHLQYELLNGTEPNTRQNQ